MVPVPMSVASVSKVVDGEVEGTSVFNARTRIAVRAPVPVRWVVGRR